jgi:hypothetical protein
MLLSSCVTRKKYNDMAEEKTSEKAVLEEVLNKLAVENDSLTRLIYELDSLYRYEKGKSNIAYNTSNTNGKNTERGLKVKPKRGNISGKEEYEKKAIFVYNFLSYIFWPSDPKIESFNIGIVGESPIRQALAANVYGKSVNKLPIVVENYVAGKNYKILFFTEAGQSQFNKIKKQVGSDVVLFVTENSLLENIGSHISLYVDGNKVKFTANRKSLEKSKLKVSNTFYSLSD